MLKSVRHRKELGRPGKARSGDPRRYLDKVVVLPIEDIKPAVRNARTHSTKQIRQIATSIQQFGFTSPVLIDEDNVILAGHGRVAAARLLGLETLPCLPVTHLTAAEKRAYAIADNQIAVNAGWDDELLALEVLEIQTLDPAFDLSVTGFSVAELDLIIENRAPTEQGDPADDRIPNKVPARCRRGDVWTLGPHRLICGDARDRTTIAALMGGEMAEMVFTDPPYNVPVNGHVGGSGKTKHREFAMASGEMTPTQFTQFLRTVFEGLIQFSQDGSIHYICMDWRHMREVMDAAGELYAEFKNLIVWVKDNGGMGTFYRSRHELIFAFKNGTAEHVNSFELGQHGRYRTNVWEYRGVNTLKAGRQDELALHPTVKPTAMIVDAIKDASHRGGVVLDLFGGSGSTLIAAHKSGRRARICEIDEPYCDIIIRRWEVFAKDDAVQVACGLPDDHPARTTAIAASNGTMRER